jgi:hypothetical protein
MLFSVATILLSIHASAQDDERKDSLNNNSLTRFADRRDQPTTGTQRELRPPLAKISNIAHSSLR